MRKTDASEAFRSASSARPSRAVDWARRRPCMTPARARVRCFIVFLVRTATDARRWCGGRILADVGWWGNLCRHFPDASGKSRPLLWCTNPCSPMLAQTAGPATHPQQDSHHAMAHSGARREGASPSDPTGNPMTQHDITTQALACRDAAQAIAELSSAGKRELLQAMAAQLEAQAPMILAANARDMEAAQARGTKGAMLDRLRLDAGRLAGIANAVREVASLPDPVGQVTRRETRPNGIEVQRVRVPLGVVTMIYEARPNVTADAAALCLYAGNGVILRGGSEAIHSNTAIAAALQQALAD